VLLAAVCVLVFAPVFTAGITNWDEVSYLSAPQSQRVSVGTFTDVVFGSFHPLTIFSFAVEQQFFGRNALLLHATNVAFHAASAILVFLLLQQLTGAPFGAFAGALLWAVHPLRVESVAWIAERKDVLCTFFFVAALLAYVHRRLPLTLVFFILALLSKGMAVSLPLAMLAIDYLQRRKAIIEKIPFFALTLLFGIIGFLGQRGPGAAMDMPGFAFTPLAKVALSCQTILFYFGKVFLPIGLNAIYPYPAKMTMVEWLSPLFVIAIAIFVAITTRVTRAIAFAFAFFIVTIAVVLPLFSWSHTIAADRFTYIPTIGIAYLVARIARPKGWPIVAILAGVLGVMSFNRCKIWHDSITLWTSVIDAGPSISTAYNGRAVELATRGRFADAVRDLDQAIAIDPCYTTALRNRLILAQQFGDTRGAGAARDRLAKCRK
jgi:hypothetical protein